MLRNNPPKFEIRSYGKVYIQVPFLGARSVYFASQRKMFLEGKW